MEILLFVWKRLLVVLHYSSEMNVSFLLDETYLRIIIICCEAILSVLFCFGNVHN